MGTLLRGGTVVDGTGGPRYTADVLVEGDRIAAVGPDAAGRAGRVVDVDGMVVAPGFVDMHAHSDLRLLTEPAHLAKVSQGVTTEVLGQDGLSYAPVDDAVLPVLRRAIAGWNGDPGADFFTWRTVAEYLDRLDEGIAGNAAYLVPHGTVRALVCGWDDRPATQAEIARMADVVRTGMDQGAVGLSAGLTYTPGMYADGAELAALCAAVGERGGFFSPHHRSYGAGALEAYAEMVDVAERSGCALHLAHATLNFGPNKGRAGELITLLDAAVDRGVDITLDTYPYLPGATTLSAILPSWCQSGGLDAARERLRDPAALARIREDLEVHGSDGCHGVVAEWETIEISGVTNPELAGTVGRTVADIAGATGADPFDTCVDILLRDDFGTGILQHVGHEENVRAIMRHPRHTGGSDGLLVGAKPHPRAWGTFPRYLGHYCRELGLFSLEECVHHLTGRAADRLRLADRGRVRPGLAADLVVFDPDTVTDTATFAEPAQQAAGIPYVLVNGAFAVDGGERTDALAGRALRRRADGRTAPGTHPTGGRR